jgi:hypothetical protein
VAQSIKRAGGNQLVVIFDFFNPTNGVFYLTNNNFVILHSIVTLNWNK